MNITVNIDCQGNLTEEQMCSWLEHLLTDEQGVPARVTPVKRYSDSGELPRSTIRCQTICCQTESSGSFTYNVWNRFFGHWH